jgi:hypothetical protein
MLLIGQSYNRQKYPNRASGVQSTPQFPPKGLPVGAILTISNIKPNTHGPRPATFPPKTSSLCTCIDREDKEISYAPLLWVQDVIVHHFITPEFEDQKLF